MTNDDVHGLIKAAHSAANTAALGFASNARNHADNFHRRAGEIKADEQSKTDSHRP